MNSSVVTENPITTKDLFTGIVGPDSGSKLLYSSIYFTLAYIAVTYTGHAWTTANAWSLGYDPLFSFDGMDTLRHTTGWTATKIAWVYLASPLWGLFISVLWLLIFHRVLPRYTHLRTLLLWLSIHGFLHYFSFILTGLFYGEDITSTFYTGFVAYYKWLHWDCTQINGTLVLLGLISLPYTFLYSKPIMRLSHSKRLSVTNYVVRVYADNIHLSQKFLKH